MPNGALDGMSPIHVGNVHSAVSRHTVILYMRKSEVWLL